MESTIVSGCGLGVASGLGSGSDVASGLASATVDVNFNSEASGGVILVATSAGGVKGAIRGATLDGGIVAAGVAVVDGASRVAWPMACAKAARGASVAAARTLTTARARMLMRELFGRILRPSMVRPFLICRRFPRLSGRPAPPNDTHTLP